MSKSSALDLAATIFLLAVVYLLVKPGSLAPRMIGAVGDALQGIVTHAVHG